MKISTLFMLNAVVLSDSELSALRGLFAEWVIVNSKNGRMLVSAIIDDDLFSTAESMLSAYDLAVVGKWDDEGNALMTLTNLSEFVSLMPPVLSFVNMSVIETPRTVAADVCGWAGWAERKFH